LISCLAELNKVDPGINNLKAKDCIFRIYRDVRFSKNKEPYKSNFGAFMVKGGKKSNFAGYYIHIEPDQSFVGGGIYMPEPGILRSIREEIYTHTEEYKSIIGNKTFRKYFPEIYGEKLSTAPKGFPKDFPDIDLLKNKHYAVAHYVKDSFWTSKNIISDLTEIFSVQYRFNEFLNRAVNHTQ
jgi:uncharacterized protein (TIGR02453 family)